MKVIPSTVNLFIPMEGNQTRVLFMLSPKASEDLNIY
jgi:hypothetical protein